MVLNSIRLNSISTAELPGAKLTSPRNTQEATVIVGRQGGKTSRIGAIIAVYEAFRDHGLKRGERAYVLLIAPVTNQAQIAFNYIRNYIFASPVLKNKVVKVRKSEIDLDNGITISMLSLFTNHNTGLKGCGSNS